MSACMHPCHLPRDVLPSRYNLTMRPDLQEGTFAGTVGIELEAIQSTDTIWLNCVELDIFAVALVDDDGDSACTPEVELLEHQERLRLGFRAPLRPGGYRLTLGFEGVLDGRMRGFHRFFYKDRGGNERAFATTQFGSTDARRAFPCFDEPDFKAVFGVTMIVPSGLCAVSNAEIISEAPSGPGWRRVRFDDTARMSAHLVALTVGPLEAIRARCRYASGTRPTRAGGPDLR